MTLTLELPPELEARLKAEAARLGLPPAQYALHLLEAHLPGTADHSRREHQAPLPKAPTARELLSMSAEERKRVLEAQAEDAAPLYADDLARPASERELTAFTALDGEPFHDET
jgi:hypothetical protein